MPDPVDVESFAELVARFNLLVTQQSDQVAKIRVKRQNGAGPRTLTHADDGGKENLIWNDASTATITINLRATEAEGTIFIVRQYNLAPLRFSPAAGATLEHRLDHNGTAGRSAVVTARCLGNSDGTSAEWYLDGDTAVIA